MARSKISATPPTKRGAQSRCTRTRRRRGKPPKLHCHPERSEGPMHFALVITTVCPLLNFLSRPHRGPDRMRTFALFAIVILMSTAVIETTAQTLPSPQAVTDPKQIASEPNAQVEPRSLTIEKLYMTRQVGRPPWSPDGKRIAFISNMNGRNNISIVSTECGLPQHRTAS